MEHVGGGPAHDNHLWWLKRVSFGPSVAVLRSRQKDRIPRAPPARALGEGRTSFNALHRSQLTSNGRCSSGMQPRNRYEAPRASSHPANQPAKRDSRLGSSSPLKHAKQASEPPLDIPQSPIEPVCSRSRPTHRIQGHEKGGVGFLVRFIRRVEEDAFGFECRVLYGISE